MLCKKAVYNGLCLKVHTPLIFNYEHERSHFLLLTLTRQALMNKQIYSKNHYHQKNFSKKNNLNLFLVLLLMLFLLLMF